MRRWLAIALMLGTRSSARADAPGLDIVETITAADLARLEPDVAIDHLWFADRACMKRFGTATRSVSGDERRALLACLNGLAPVAAYVAHGSRASLAATSTEWIAQPGVRFRSGLVVRIDETNGRLSALGAFGPEGLPEFVTGEGAPSEVTPAPTTYDAIAHKRVGYPQTTVAVCVDAKGAITQQGIVETSGVAAYDLEMLALAKTSKPKPLVLGGVPLASCELSQFQYEADG